MTDPIEATAQTLRDERDAARAALHEIVEPIRFMEIRAASVGGVIDGRMAQTLARDPEYLRSIARAVLTPAPSPKG